MHRTRRYIWSRTFQLIDQKLHPDAPWLVRYALPYIDHFLHRSSEGVEWGSGRSTVWFARRVRYFMSIEDNHGWYSEVEKRLMRENLQSKVNYRYIDPKDQDGYVQVAESIIDCGLDFALIDGSRSRVDCSLVAVRKLKPGGILILDNAERYLAHPSLRDLPEYLQANASGHGAWEQVSTAISNWDARWFNDGVSATAVFTKP